MEHSETLQELGAALASAQRQVKHVVNDGKNPYFRSEYATLTSVWNTLKEVLPENNLSVIQTVGRLNSCGDILDFRQKDGVTDSKSRTAFSIQVTTMLLHSSGQWVKDTQEIPLTKVDAQGAGAAITYGRRFGLASICGVCPEVDDDGETAAGRGETKDKYLQEENTSTPEDQDNYKRDKKNMLGDIKSLVDILQVTPEQAQKLTGKTNLAKCGLDTLEEVFAYLSDVISRKELGTLTDKELDVLGLKEVTA